MTEQPIIAAGVEKILSLPEETKFAPNGIVSRTLLRTPDTRVVLFGFAPGQELTEHTSTQHAVVHILSGECEFFLAGRPHPAKAGDLIYMPPNLPHALKAASQFSMLLTLSKPDAAADTDLNLKNDMQTENLIGPDKVMDVRAIPCSIKHGLIVRTWIELPAGEHFVLLNDHDPVPLRYQFAAQWPDTFTWEHLVNLPGEARVKITKLKPLGEPAQPIATECGEH